MHGSRAWTPLQAMCGLGMLQIVSRLSVPPKLASSFRCALVSGGQEERSRAVQAALARRGARPGAGALVRRAADLRGPAAHAARPSAGGLCLMFLLCHSMEGCKCSRKV